MKILHIIPNLKKGGAERLVLDICNELQKREGVIVKLITFKPDNEYEFLSENIDWEVVPAFVELSLVRKNIIQVELLQKAIEDFQPDIIHSHLYEADLVSRSCLFPNAKWFFHCHSNLKVFKKNHKVLKNNIVYKFERNYLFNRFKENGGNNFIAISKNTFNYFKDKVKDYSLSFLPNAIDYTRFYVLEEKKLNNILQLVNIGSLTKLKNQVFLIEVANYLKQLDIDFKLYILGEGVLRNILEEKIKKYSLQNNVILVGSINDVNIYLKECDIYLHSSTSESFGLTTIEAMAAGLPVVTLDAGGNKDLIVEGKNGFLLKTEDVKNFTDKILEIHQNPEKHQQMSNFAKDFAKQYDIVEYVDKLSQLYITAQN
jgi:glycosyltransferase involved in cell wall biosynthesis